MPWANPRPRGASTPGSGRSPPSSARCARPRWGSPRPRSATWSRRRRPMREAWVPQVELYDTTLRDGAQRSGLSFSVEDKLKVLLALDSLGVPFVEGGWPGANPRDTEFFRLAARERLRQATLSAFGLTRK